ncbi:NUDIX hydrolase [Streptomyces sp. NPDC048659]|uniref:NUDIX hydrolase n=1 Tax=Streptomyces sp. NPDC048659 TaxID=3155489 RepID=UPI00344119D3
MQTELRVAAYAVCVRDGQLLLARWVDRAGVRRWTLPGGGVDHGELPLDAVVREVEEETGYLAEATALLGIDSIRRQRTRPLGGSYDWQGLRILYEARVTGGALRSERGGSTDLAAWHPLDAVPALTRVELVDIGLQLLRDRPPLGHSPLHDPANG